MLFPKSYLLETAGESLITGSTAKLPSRVVRV